VVKELLLRAGAVKSLVMRDSFLLHR
jgi:hypothetical protein